MALRKAINDKQIIVMKVRVEDMIGVRRKGREYKDIQSDRGRIKSRHFDFVLCNLGMKPIAIIEVDDGSHSSDKAKKADDFKDALAQAVSVPLLRFKATPTATVEEIKEKLQSLS